MATISCFWVDRTTRVQRFLRRFRWQGACPLVPGEFSYHNANVRVEDGPLVLHEEGYIANEEPDRRDSRWPQACGCGEPFRDDDEWQVWIDPIYRDGVTGAEWGLRELPPGAMYDAPWFGDFAKGPDGRNLVCIIPPHHEWLIDGPASNAPHDSRGWQRTGTPPRITAHPSVHLPGIYHGWLRDGKLVDA